MPSTHHAELLQVEAQVLDHVVGRGVADHRGAGVQRGRHQRVLGDGVAALGEHDRADRLDRAVDAGVVHAVGRLDLEAERAAARTCAARRCACRGCSRRRTAARSSSLRCSSGPRNMITERVRRAASSSMRPRSSSVGGMISRSFSSLSQRVWTPRLVEHLEQAVDLLDPGDLAQRGPAAVEQRGAEQRDAGVLGGLDLDRAGQRGRPGDAQVRGAGAERHDLGVEGRADAGEHLEREVLVTLLDPVDRALAGGQQLGELVLGEPAVLAGVTDEIADAALVVRLHADHGISDMRYDNSSVEPSPCHAVPGGVQGSAYMRATTIHAPGDIRVDDVPDPTIQAPTDAIVKVTAGCICGSDLWPYRGDNDVTPGDTIGHECIGVVEEVGSRGHRLQARRLRHRAVRPLRQHLRALPRRRARGLRQPRLHRRAARRSTPGSPRPNGIHGQDRRHARPRADPLAADALRRDGHRLARGRGPAGVTPGRHRRRRRRRRGRPLRRPRRRPAGRRAGHRDVAPRAAPGDRPPVRRHPHRRRARRGGRRADRGDHRRRRRATPSSSASAPTSRSSRPSRSPVPARRSASSACRTASSCRCAGCSRRTSASPAAWRRCASTSPSCSSWSCQRRDRPRPGLRHHPAARAVAGGLPRDGRARAIKVLLEP